MVVIFLPVCSTLFEHLAHYPEEDVAVLGGNSPEPVGGCADAVRGQAAVHSVPRAGSHGGHPGLPPRGNAAGSHAAGTAPPAWEPLWLLPVLQEQWFNVHQNTIK